MVSVVEDVRVGVMSLLFGGGSDLSWDLNGDLGINVVRDSVVDSSFNLSTQKVFGLLL